MIRGIALWLGSFVFFSSIVGRADEDGVLLEWRLDSPQSARAYVSAVAENGKVRLGFRPGDRGAPNEFRRTIGVIWIAKPVQGEREGVELFSAKVLEATTEGLALEMHVVSTYYLAAGDEVIVRNAQGDKNWNSLRAPLFASLSKNDESLGAAAQAVSQNNLKQIMLALHNYHDTFRRFPPAYVYGPDGKPWHSWRVLILPFVEQAPLYNAYRFNEPWDSEHNRQLLDKKPAVYHDPSRGKEPDQFTHYAAAVGKNTCLSDRGSTVTEDARLNLRGTSMADIIDGTSNTATIGPTSSKTKIPWTKPEDISVEGLSTIEAAKDQFGWPFGGKSRAAPFGFADGSVRMLPQGLSNESLLHLWTINDGNPIDPNIAEMAKAARSSPVLRLVRKGGELQSELVLKE